MRKLIRGVVNFRQQKLDNYRDRFAHLAASQSPDALFIACSDSRVVPNTFASTDPGDLFVVRNVGNIVCPCGEEGVSCADVSEFAAIEFAVTQLGVSDIIVCGHSECGAMKAILEGKTHETMPHLRSWLRYGEPSLDCLRAGRAPDPTLSSVNQLSQINVLLQLEHLKSYEIVRERIQTGTLKLHAWWFDLSLADVYVFDSNVNRFRILDASFADELLSTIGV
jgi:carbonic anhydrase